MAHENARTAALERLPVAYAEALRCREAGLPVEELARRLGVDPAAVGLLLEIAEAKLATAMAEEAEL